MPIGYGTIPPRGGAMNIVIVGAGGHGRVVLECIRLGAAHIPIGFLDADPTRTGASVMGVPILGPINLLDKLKKRDVHGIIVAIGDNRVRQSYAQLVSQTGLELVNAIHPAATISPTAKLGRNVQVMAGAVIGTEAIIGDSAIINTAAVVDHECHVGPAVHVAPGALLAGRVELEEGSFVGLGARILPCLKVGAYATVGAGAVVLEDVPPATTVAGVPARPISGKSATS